MKKLFLTFLNCSTKDEQTDFIKQVADTYPEGRLIIESFLQNESSSLEEVTALATALLEKIPIEIEDQQYNYINYSDTLNILYSLASGWVETYIRNRDYGMIIKVVSFLATLWYEKFPYSILEQLNLPTYHDISAAMIDQLQEHLDSGSDEERIDFFSRLLSELPDIKEYDSDFIQYFPECFMYRSEGEEKSKSLIRKKCLFKSYENFFRNPGFDITEHLEIYEPLILDYFQLADFLGINGAYTQSLYKQFAFVTNLKEKINENRTDSRKPENIEIHIKLQENEDHPVEHDNFKLLALTEKIKDLLLESFYTDDTDKGEYDEG